MYKLAEIKAYKKIDLKSTKEIIEDYGTTSPIGKTLKEVITNLIEQVKQLPSLPDKVNSNEVKILKLPNFEKITEKRRKRATTRYVPSILEDNEKAFFLTAKKTLCKKPNGENFRLKSKCLKLFLEKIKSPVIDNAGSQILHKLVSYFENNNLDVLNQQFAEKLGFSNNSHEYILNRLQVELDDRTWFAPVSDQPREITNQQTLLEEFRENLLKQKTKVEKHTKEIVENTGKVEKNKKSNELSGKRIKKLKGVSMYRKLIKIIEYVMQANKYRLINQQRYIQTEVYKDGQEGIVLELVKLEKLGKAEILAPFEICGETCCSLSATGSYVKLDEGEKYYPLNSCNEYQGILICAEKHLIYEVTCPILKQECLQSSDIEYTAEEQLSYLSNTKAIYHPEEKVDIGPLTMLPPKIYIIQSKDSVTYDLKGVRLVLKATESLQYSFKLTELPYDRYEVENSCRIDQSFKKRYMPWLNMTGIILLLTIILIVVIVFGCNKQPKQQRQPEAKLIQKDKDLRFKGVPEEQEMEPLRNSRR